MCWVQDPAGSGDSRQDGQDGQDGQDKQDGHHLAGAETTWASTQAAEVAVDLKSPSSLETGLWVSRQPNREPGSMWKSGGVSPHKEPGGSSCSGRMQSHSQEIEKARSAEGQSNRACSPYRCATMRGRSMSKIGKKPCFNSCCTHP